MTNKIYDIDLTQTIEIQPQFKRLTNLPDGLQRAALSTDGNGVPVGLSNYIFEIGMDDKDTLVASCDYVRHTGLTDGLQAIKLRLNRLGVPTDIATFKPLNQAQKDMLNIHRCAGTMRLEYHRVTDAKYELRAYEIVQDANCNLMTKTTVIDTFIRDAKHGIEQAVEHPANTWTMSKHYWKWMGTKFEIDPTKTTTRVEKLTLPANHWQKQTDPKGVVNGYKYISFKSVWDKTHYHYTYPQTTGTLLSRPHKADTFEKQNDLFYKQYSYTFTFNEHGDKNTKWQEVKKFEKDIKLTHPLSWTYDHKVDATLQQKIVETWIWNSALHRFEMSNKVHTNYPRSTSPAEGDKMWVVKPSHANTMQRKSVHYVWHTAPTWSWVRTDKDLNMDRTHADKPSAWIIDNKTLTARYYDYKYTFNKNGDDSTDWVEHKNLKNTIVSTEKNSSSTHNVDASGKASTSESHLVTITHTFDETKSQWIKHVTYTNKKSIVQVADIPHVASLNLATFIRGKKLSRNIDIILRIKNGIKVGHISTGSIPSGAGGLTLQVDAGGEIQGTGGAINGGNGGDALTLTSNIKLINNGWIRGGGGGGNKGTTGATKVVALAVGNFNISIGHGSHGWSATNKSGSWTTVIHGPCGATQESRYINKGSHICGATVTAPAYSGTFTIHGYKINKSISGGKGGNGGHGRGYGWTGSLAGSNGTASKPSGGNNGGKGHNGDEWGKGDAHSGHAGHSIVGKSHLVTGSKTGNVNGLPV